LREHDALVDPLPLTVPDTWLRPVGCSGLAFCELISPTLTACRPWPHGQAPRTDHSAARRNPWRTPVHVGLFRRGAGGHRPRPAAGHATARPDAPGSNALWPPADLSGRRFFLAGDGHFGVVDLDKTSTVPIDDRLRSPHPDGHGVAVLLKIYAHCIDGQATAANQRIAEALGTQGTEQDLGDEGDGDMEQAS